MSIGFILAVIFSALLFIFGVSMAAGQYQRGQVTAGIQAPEWIFGAPVPGTLSALCAVPPLVEA